MAIYAISDGKIRWGGSLYFSWDHIYFLFGPCVVLCQLRRLLPIKAEDILGRFVHIPAVPRRTKLQWYSRVIGNHGSHIFWNTLWWMGHVPGVLEHLDFMPTIDGSPCTCVFYTVFISWLFAGSYANQTLGKEGWYVCAMRICFLHVCLTLTRTCLPNFTVELFFSPFGSTRFASCGQAFATVHCSQSSTVFSSPRSSGSPMTISWICGTRPTQAIGPPRRGCPKLNLRNRLL
jgi:hypothetical protein